MAKHVDPEYNPPLTPTAPPDGADPTPKKVRPKPDSITAMRRVSAILETQDVESRKRIIAFLSSYYGSLEKP
jgi:hypothetical protein